MSCVRETVTCTLRTKKQEHVTFSLHLLYWQNIFFFELLLSSHLAVVFFIVPLFTQALVSTSGCHVNVTVDSRIYKKGYSLKTSEI